MNDVGVIFCKNYGFAVVDSDMVSELSKYVWNSSWDGYIYTSIYKDGKSHWKGMGAFILDTQKGLQCDHINGYIWDNRKCNLRVATLKENQRNQGKRWALNPTSEFKGVYWSEYHKAWRAQIRVDGKKKHLGTFKNQQSAALVDNEYASRHFGQFARLNRIEQEPLSVEGEQKGML